VFTAVAFYYAPENPIAAFVTYIAGFFISNPFFCTKLSPIRHSSQNNLFANSHREIVNITAGEIRAFMAPSVALPYCAAPDLTLAAMHLVTG
jgi:hypothetical protein